MKQNSLIFLILLLFATSCATQKRCFDKWAEVVYHDTITYNDTTFYVFIKPVDTVYVQSSIKDTVYANAGSAGGQAWVVNDTIFLNVWQRDTIVEYRDSIKTVTKEITKIIEEPCDKPVVLNRIIIIAFILLAIFLVAKIKF